MNDAELRDAALAELRQTTVGYRNVHWTTPPAGTHWRNAIDLLQQIGPAPIRVGLNCYGALGKCGPTIDLSVLRPGSALRFWAFRSQVDLNWQNLDDLIVAARARRIGLVPVLTNQWADCDGLTADDTYSRYLAQIGARYRDEPSIILWQLGNEMIRDAAWFADHAAILHNAVVTQPISFGAYNNMEHVNVYDGDGAVAIDDYFLGSTPMPTWLAARLAMCKDRGLRAMVTEAGIAASIDPRDRAAWFRAKIAKAAEAGVELYFLWGWRTTDGWGIGPGDPSLALLGG